MNEEPTPSAPAAGPAAPATPAAPKLAAAIVGRPNVGKSALFNRMAGRKIAIVHDQPGITRDRLVAECRPPSGGTFEIIDTGGIGSEADGDFSARVALEADIALAAASVILFVVDGRAGLTPVDATLARKLRRTDKPVLLVINKIDQDMHIPHEGEFARLGFKEIHGVSAAHGRNVGELSSAVARHLDAQRDPDAGEADAPEVPRVPHLVLVGRPNVGKSSLTNAMLGEARTIVSNVSGTTRDAVDVPCQFGGKDYVLIDTAGIRHRGKRDNSAEIFSVMRSEEGIRRADLCVLVIDASAGITAQDRQIAGLIQKANKPCVVAVNKWDLLTPSAGTSQAETREFRQQWLADAEAELFFISHAPLVALSALEGRQVGRLFTAIETVRRAASEHLGTGALNRLFHAAIEIQPPPMRQNRRFKLLYATQIEDKRGTVIPVPAFLLFVNDPGLLTDTYRKYLENKLRAAHPFPGLPILLKQRGREPKEGQGK